MLELINQVEKKPITPEVMLKNFNKVIMKLLRASLILNHKSIEEDLKIFLRKTLISEIFFDKYTIAVSGLQGVGKTTLIKQLYDLPANILPENIGRGEKLPIMITECDIKEMELWVKKLKKTDKFGYEIKDERINTVDEFNNITLNPKINDILLELKFPLNSNVFNTPEYKSFILLPGVEDDENEWQQLTEHSLTSAATCLFVFTNTSFAGEKNEKLLNKIQNNFDKAKPIYVLSHSDESEDGNAELKETVINRLNICKNEEDRVICTGIKKIVGDEWINELVKSLHKYSAIERDFRKSQIDNLDNLLLSDLGIILSKIKRDNSIIDINNESKEIDVNKFLEFVDEGIKKVRETYSILTKKSLDAYVSKPIKNAENMIAGEKRTKKVTKIFVRSSLKDMIKFREDIKKCWETSNEYSPLEAQTYVLNNLLSKEFTLHNQLPISYDKNNNRNKLLGNYDSDGRGDYKIDDSILNDYAIIFRGKNSDEKLTSEGYKKSLILIPVLAMEFLRIFTIFPELIDIDKKTIKPKQNITEIVDNFVFLRAKNGLILGGLASIMGIDIIPDGEFNILSNILIKFGLPTALATKIALSAAAVIGVGILMVCVINQLNKMDIKDAYVARDMLLSIKDQYYSQYMENYDSMMDYIRELVKNRLYDRYKIDISTAYKERILKALSDAEYSRHKMREVLFDYRQGMERTLSKTVRLGL